jgi:hypothetical protein
MPLLLSKTTASVATWTLCVDLPALWYPATNALLQTLLVVMATLAVYGKP